MRLLFFSFVSGTRSLWAEGQGLDKGNGGYYIKKYQPPHRDQILLFFLFCLFKFFLSLFLLGLITRRGGSPHGRVVCVGEGGESSAPRAPKTLRELSIG